MAQEQKNLDASKPSKQLKDGNKALSEHSGQKSEAELTFEDFDKLNLKSFGDDVLRVIEGDKVLSEDQNACTISLNADFGQGKTVFLKMLKSFIEDQKMDKVQNNDKNDLAKGQPDCHQYAVLFIDAWKNDFFKEPIITILSEFLEYLEKNTKGMEAIKAKTFKIIGSIITQSAFQWTKDFMHQNLKNIGLDVNNMKQIVEGFSQNKESIGATVFKEFQQRKEILKEIKSIISDYTKDGKKLLVIVDELDRARPDYAVHFLEDIKHFFDIENVIFIFGINKKQIEATVKTLYGEDLNFEGYYRKFFKHEMDLPDPYQEAKNFIINLLNKTDIYTSMHNINNPKNIDSLFKTFKLKLRELIYLIGICNIVLSETSEDDERNYKYSSSVLFFIFLYIKRKEVFKKVLNNAFTLDDFFKFIDDEKIPYKDNEEKCFLSEVAFSFLNPRPDFFIPGDNTLNQKFKDDRKKIETKLKLNNEDHLVSSPYFSIDPDLCMTEPCLIICNAIVHQKPFYKNKLGF